VQPSSLVFVAIVALWAGGLLPHWIRRRDAVRVARGEDRHSVALRVLTRRGPRRRGGPSTAPLLRGTPGPAETEPVATQIRTAAGATTGAARRRVGVLVALLAVTAVAVAGTLSGAVPTLVAVVAASLLGADLVALRGAAVQRRRRRAVEAARAPAPPRIARPSRGLGPEPAAVVPAARAQPDVAEQEPLVVEAPVAAQPDDGTWVPIPVPPPTYTLKPMAPRPEPAPLHLAPVAPVLVVAAATTVFPEAADVDLDSVLERRRAVNG
jgi:hypothetical protein